jgi:Flp pilus assembly pilin Flp
MRTLQEKLYTIADDRKAVTMLEYAIMGSLIAAMLTAAVPPITAPVVRALQFMADSIPAK